MIRLPRFRNLPVTVRVPLVTAALMIVPGLLASQTVLLALGRVQDARLSETARLHLEGLSVALGPSVLRQDVWEVYDILDRARAATDGQRLLLTIVADERGQVLAATDPRRAPVDESVTGFEAGAVAPDAIRMTGGTVLRVLAPLKYQGREVGRIVTELDVTDLLAERRAVTLWLLLGNAVATAVMAFGGWLAVARILRPVGTLVRAMDDSKGAPRSIGEAVVPSKSNRRFPAEFDRDTYKWRHLIENFFGKLKEYRGTATRCCKTDTSFSAFIAIAATVIRLQ